MNAFIKKFLNFGATFTNQFWWPMWSNFRWRNSTRHNIGIEPEDKVNNLHDLDNLLSKLLKKFTWTKDGPDQLYDSITPPPRNYERYQEGLLEDDCDGFHSLVYHCLYNSNIECYLMSTCAVKSGHCVLVLRFEDKWHVVDYGTIYGGFYSLKQAIENYNESYVTIYNTKSEVFFNGLLSYNYIVGKLQSESIKKLEAKYSAQDTEVK